MRITKKEDIRIKDGRLDPTGDRVDWSKEAPLQGVDLWLANLQGANLWGADLRGVDLTDENVAALLLCSWNVLSSDLTTELMRLDAANHPDPSRFDAWAQGGACPYQGLPVKRVAQFQESRKLWSPGPARPAKELLLRIFEEKGVRF